MSRLEDYVRLLLGLPTAYNLSLFQTAPWQPWVPSEAQLVFPLLFSGSHRPLPSEALGARRASPLPTLPPAPPSPQTRADGRAALFSPTSISGGSASP